MPDMKQILFNTDMVRGLLANRKTVTRRVMKGYALEHLELDTDGSIIGVYDQLEGHVRPVMDYAPYRPGDVLYARETWRIVDYLDGLSLKFEYEADGKISDFIDFTNDRLKKFLKYISRKKWCQSLFMPREAARIFLRVTDVRVERLQDITEERAKKEGAEPAFEYNTPEGPVIVFDEDGYCVLGFKALWNSLYAKPRPIRGEDGTIDHYESYPWEDINETRTYKGKPRYVIGNPWVWVIEFERISREGAMGSA